MFLSLKKRSSPIYLHLFLRQSCPHKHGGRIDVSQQWLKAANEASRYLYVYDVTDLASLRMYILQRRSRAPSEPLPLWGLTLKCPCGPACAIWTISWTWTIKKNVSTICFWRNIVILLQHTFYQLQFWRCCINILYSATYIHISKKIFWRMWVTKQSLVHIDFDSREKKIILWKSLWTSNCLDFHLLQNSIFV